MSVGAALGLVIAEGTTHARIGASIKASGAVEVVTETEKDLSVIASAREYFIKVKYNYTFFL